MWTVAVYSVEVDSQPKLVGLFWGLAATWHQVLIRQMNQVNLCIGCAVMTAW